MHKYFVNDCSNILCKNILIYVVNQALFISGGASESRMLYPGHPHACVIITECNNTNEYSEYNNTNEYSNNTNEYSDESNDSTIIHPRRSCVVYLEVPTYLLNPSAAASGDSSLPSADRLQHAPCGA